MGTEILKISFYGYVISIIDSLIDLSPAIVIDAIQLNQLSQPCGPCTFARFQYFTIIVSILLALVQWFCGLFVFFLYAYSAGKYSRLHKKSGQASVSLDKDSP